MLDVTQANLTNHQPFIKDLMQDTDETIQVAAVLKRHKETSGENNWLRQGPATLPDDETSLQDDDDFLTVNPMTDSAAHRIVPSALEELKILASRLYSPEKQQQSNENAVATLEAIANPVKEEKENDMQLTQFIPAVKQEPVSDAILPKMSIYQSPVDAPWDILHNACFSHMRQHDRHEPLCLRISGKLAWKLARDVEMLTGSQFREMYFLFFSPAKQDIVNIPIIIDQNLGEGEYGATQTVICIS
jgi:hypothetical protein